MQATFCTSCTSALAKATSSTSATQQGPTFQAEPSGPDKPFGKAMTTPSGSVCVGYGELERSRAPEPVSSTANCSRRRTWRCRNASPCFWTMSVSSRAGRFGAADDTVHPECKGRSVSGCCRLSLSGQSIERTCDLAHARRRQMSVPRSAGDRPWPSGICTVRMSTPSSRKWLAKQWRMERGVMCWLNLQLSTAILMLAGARA
jgi:hypothetical protein